MKERRFIRFITKLFSISLVTVMVLLVGAMAFFAIYRNEISKEILNRTNNLIEGEIQFKDISISPFKQFPDLSISLDDVVFYERKNDTNEVIIPIATLDHIYIAFNFEDLKKREFNVKKILLNNGVLSLTRYPDSTLNIIKGIRATKTETVDIAAIDSVIILEKSDIHKDSNLNKSVSALFDEISIQNVKVEYKDLIKDKHSSMHLDHLKSNFTWKKDSVFLGLKVDGYIINQQIFEELSIKDFPIQINTETYILPHDSIIVFEKSYVKIDKSTIHTYGGIDYKKNKLLSEIKFSSEDVSLHLLDLILPENENFKLDSGNIIFNGSLYGDLLNTIPRIKTEYIINNASFSVLNQSKHISAFNFKGYFDSGEMDDLSDALLRIDTFSAILPNGHVFVKGWVQNWVHPSIEYVLDLNMDLSEANSLFDSTAFSDLSGNLDVFSKFSGHFNPKTNDIKKKYSEITIICDSVKANIGNDFAIDYLNGIISGNTDTLCFDNLSCIIGNNDATINGNVYGLKNLILQTKNAISANLTIQSYRFHLIDLFPNNTSIGEGFPYPIEGISIDVNASTNLKKLTESPGVPEIDFIINHLRAEIIDLLPPIEINHALFSLGNKDSSLYLDFKDVDLDIAGGNINADVVFAAPHDKESYLTVRGDVEQINPGLIFQKDDAPITDVLNAYIDGYVDTRLLLSPTSNVLFHTSTILIENLAYYGIKDTISMDYLHINADTIAYNLDINKNPLASLKSNFYIEAKNIATEKFQLNQTTYEVNAANGNYHIVPGDTQWLGSEGIGEYNISPFTNPATFDIAYEVNQFKAESLLKSVKIDSVLTGMLDLNIHLKFEGMSKKEILNSINGQIILKGNNLTYHGIDMDKLIEKLKRSQNFSLADIGAVMIAGPIGLAVTKGSDYSRLLISNGDATHINQLHTQWNLNKGKLTTEDVAVSTVTNRIAAKGWIKPLVDSLYLDIAVLNPTGCSAMSQNLHGKISSPKISELKLFSSIVAPVTNLFEKTFSPDCEPFYEGNVKHPLLEE